ncbi:hypothetical protein Bca4012_000001 [Brassica carinata]|uniref:MTHFR SAM-binding regulatory domain-containing protein n=1 Tax=Brassica oleracea TaxID=3712 RepID=A0A3P6ABH9_BRAOL|nr:unnamed protein product [Brassica oleracea]
MSGDPIVLTTSPHSARMGWSCWICIPKGLSRVPLLKGQFSRQRELFNQPLLIDPARFKSWKDEAFETWPRNWANLYTEADPSKNWILNSLIYLSPCSCGNL